MNKRTTFGIILLVVAAVYFYLTPAYSISSDGTRVIFWVNIVLGIVLAILGLSLLVTGLRSKKDR